MDSFDEIRVLTSNDTTMTPHDDSGYSMYHNEVVPGDAKAVFHPDLPPSTVHTKTIPLPDIPESTSLPSPSVSIGRISSLCSMSLSLH
jgi:hypothetical protein